MSQLIKNNPVVQAAYEEFQRLEPGKKKKK